MNFKKYAPLLFLTLTWFACGNEHGPEQKANASALSGQISNITAQQLFLFDLAQQRGGPIDTAIVNGAGEFAFDFQPKSIGFYRISLSEGTTLILPLDPSESIHISGNALNLNSLEVEGSESAARLTSFNKFMMKNQVQQQNLNQEFQSQANPENIDSLRPIFQERFMSMENEKIALIKSMIDEQPGSFSNLALIEQLPAEQGDHLSYYKKVDQAFGDRYAESPFYQSFHSKVINLSRFAVGTEVPEINLPDPSGNLVPLSSLRGQVVLIDFWASWCKPCRRENPNVVAAYQKYKEKGFTVYGVSLDRTKEAWVNAIAKDQLTWTHVSDLKFWNSVAAKDYGVTGIPFALLIDRDGKVIGKNLRGLALHQKLAEVLQ